MFQVLIFTFSNNKPQIFLVNLGINTITFSLKYLGRYKTYLIEEFVFWNSLDLTIQKHAEINCIKYYTIWISKCRSYESSFTPKIDSKSTKWKWCYLAIRPFGRMSRFEFHIQKRTSINKSWNFYGLQLYVQNFPTNVFIM